MRQNMKMVALHVLSGMGDLTIISEIVKITIYVQGDSDLLPQLCELKAFLYVDSIKYLFNHVILTS